MKEKKHIYNETDRERVIRELKRDFPGINALDIDIEELVDKIHKNPSYIKKLMIKKDLSEFQNKKMVPTTIRKLEPGTLEYTKVMERAEEARNKSKLERGTPEYEELVKKIETLKSTKEVNNVKPI